MGKGPKAKVIRPTGEQLAGLLETTHPARPLTPFVVPTDTELQKINKKTPESRDRTFGVVSKETRGWRREVGSKRENETCLATDVSGKLDIRFPHSMSLGENNTCHLNTLFY